MKKRFIAPPVIARMPRYYRVIDELYKDNCIRISSTTLANRLGLTASQVRQDFSSFGEFGQQGYGYNVKKLRYEIQEILGINNGHKAILIGCGNLGHALIKSFEFYKAGFELTAIFDIDPTLIGEEMEGRLVRHIDTLPEYSRETSPDIAVLTVSPNAAQNIAELVADNGIKGIWNFTPYDLKLENSDVKVENVFFIDSLLLLSYKISEEQ